MEWVVLVVAPSYQLIIISSHFGVILSVSLYLAALTILLVSLEMLMDQMGQMSSALGHGFRIPGWAGCKEWRQKLFCNPAHGCRS